MNDERSSLKENKSLKDIFFHVAKQPAILLGCANVTMAIATGNPLGTGVQLGALGYACYKTIKAYRRGEDPSISFKILGAANILTAGLGFYEAALQSGTDVLTDGLLEPDIRKDVFTNLAMAGWGIGHLFKSENKDNSAYTTYGLAYFSFAVANPAAIVPAALALTSTGFLKSVYNLTIAAGKKEKDMNCVETHLTPPRCNAGANLVNMSVAGAGGEFMAIPYFFAMLGNANFETEKNTKTARALLKTSRQAITFVCRKL